MVRSMYSGVSGLRSHQTRMDTIGNNIANVNTYGFKSGRTTFRDIYYQSMTNASAPTAAIGGVNPAEVGYGTQVGSVDVMMGRSTFTMTGQGMDLAIDGEGFFQVQDGAGNIYYTRAGMMNFDAAGNLVDMQGNYVLGVNGNPVGKAPASERIQVALPNAQPAAASSEVEINGKKFALKATNTTTDGNLNFTFSTDSSMADNTMKAEVTANGISITMHPQMRFADMTAFNTAINDAIKDGNGGKDHPAGRFTLSAVGHAGIPAGGMTAEELCGTNYGIKMGSIDSPESNLFGTNFSFTGTVGSEFGAAFTGPGTPPTTTLTGATISWDGTKYTVSVTDGTNTYTGTITSDSQGDGKFNLYLGGNTNSKDYIEISRPGFDALDEARTAGTMTFPGTATLTGTATASSVSRDLGLSGTSFPLRGGTKGGPQTLADLTALAIGTNGVITGRDSVGNDITIGRIDLATFDNPGGLNQVGSTNFGQTRNSGTPKLFIPGEGGAGQLINSSLELSNVDLSNEFSDMITTQRGYQANSRIITVSDTMLEELINLKR